MNPATLLAGALAALADHPVWFALLKGSLILTVACGVHALVAWMRSPAALRHAVLLCGIGLALAVPLAGAAVPAFLRVEVPRQAATAPSAPAPIVLSAPAGHAALVVAAAPPGTRPAPVAASSATRAFRWMSTTLGGLFGLWLAGAALVLLPVALAYARLALVMRGARPVQGGRLFQSLAREAARVGVHARLRVTSRPGIAPATFGLRPFAWVILPEESAGWTDAELRLVLAHEMAHVARRDWGYALLAQLALAAHWFNPAAWWARRQLVREAECACDDRVLAAGARPSDYAEALLDLARRLPPSPRFLLPRWTSPSLPFLSPFSRRVSMLLDASRDRSPMTRRTLALLSVLALSGGALLAGVGISHAEERDAGDAVLKGDSTYAGTCTVMDGALVLSGGGTYTGTTVVVAKAPATDDADGGFEAAGDGVQTLTDSVEIDPSTPEGKELANTIIGTQSTNGPAYALKWRDGRRVFVVSTLKPGKPGPVVDGVQTVDMVEETLSETEVETQAQRDALPKKDRKAFDRLWTVGRHAVKPGEKATPEQEKALDAAIKAHEKLELEEFKKNAERPAWIGGAGEDAIVDGEAVILHGVAVNEGRIEAGGTLILEDKARPKKQD